MGLALYATDGRDRLLAQENAKLRASLAASVKAEAVAARASESKVRKLEQENELLRAQLNESAAAAAATVGGANGEAKRKLLADRTDWFTKTALCPKPIRTLKKKGEIPFVLQEEGMKFPVIALAREQKVPAYKLTALKARFPETRFVNLNFEVDYENLA